MLLAHGGLKKVLAPPGGQAQSKFAYIEKRSSIASSGEQIDLNENRDEANTGNVVWETKEKKKHSLILAIKRDLVENPVQIHARHGAHEPVAVDGLLNLVLNELAKLTKKMNISRK